MDGTAASLDDVEPHTDRIGTDEREAADLDDRVTDGRSLRRERNRDAVIVALLDLIREGDFEPSTSDIAERAGVSHRSVFRYFDDLSDLVRAAIDHAVAEVAPMAVLPPLDGAPVERRVEVWVDTLLRVYNHTFAIARVSRSRSLFIPAIDAGITRIVTIFRHRLTEQFAPELEALDEASAQDLLDAMQVVCAFESFDLLRRRLGRSDDEIRRTWTSALTAVLAP